MLVIFVKRKRINVNLILSIAWIILCGLAIFTSERGFNWVDLLYLGIGLLYFIQYYYQLKKPLITITDKAITTYSIFKSKTIGISDIIEITFPFKDVLIKSKNEKISISKDSIDEASYIRLEERLKKIKEERGI